MRGFLEKEIRVSSSKWMRLCDVLFNILYHWTNNVYILQASLFFMADRLYIPLLRSRVGKMLSGKRLYRRPFYAVYA